jgi:hypothetical protein
MEVGQAPGFCAVRGYRNGARFDDHTSEVCMRPQMATAYDEEGGGAALVAAASKRQ